ncbi:MAG: YfhO family protein, partial [Eubacterium sp.]|nr:YfhO family protein [Eubacterium sp.]
IFSYYLASPFNLFILFFARKDMDVFFTLIVVLKMAMAGATMSFFLEKRFRGTVPLPFTVLLSLGYALMQYNFAQSSNIMWLDGVYMLPLILLGVYEVAESGKILFLSISVFLAILFNWYSAGIDCLYALAWFVMELLFCQEQNPMTSGEIRTRIFRFLIALICGVLMSMVLFWPNIVAMRAGKGHFDWSLLTNTFNGNILSTVIRYSIGSISDKDAAALFCGCLPLLGSIGFFCSHVCKRRIKIVAGVMAAFSLLIFYWQPLFLLYSLMKDSTSYFFRYSYVSIFFLIFLAGMYYSHWDQEEQVIILLKGAAVFALLLLLLQLTATDTNIKYLYATGFFALAEALVLVVLKHKNIISVRKILLIFLMFLLCGAELYQNGKILARYYINQDDNDYRAYQKSQSAQIEALKKEDRGFYRISQTSTYNEYSGNIKANYNESMAFNYHGISSYTSAPQMLQLDFLDGLGYRKEADCVSVVNTSILPVDSLLGVKYILSKYAIRGYQELSSLPSADGDKKVYKNPFAFPMAFICEGNEPKSLKDENPFERVNAIYSAITGKQTRVFHKISCNQTDSTGTEKTYVLSGIGKNDVVYGNIPWSEGSECNIDVNGAYTQLYSGWLSPSVFYIPVSGTEATLTVSTENQDDLQEAQIYACDLSVMNQVSESAWQNAASDFTYRDGEIRITANAASDGENLILSVPANQGWTAKVNGKNTDIKTFAGCLMQISLKKGSNSIYLSYQIPGLHLGIAGSVAGILLLILSQFIIKRRKER